MGLAISGILAGIGLTLMLAGGGLFWVGASRKEVDTFDTITAPLKDKTSKEPANVK